MSPRDRHLCTAHSISPLSQTKSSRLVDGRVAGEEGVIAGEEVEAVGEEGEAAGEADRGPREAEPAVVPAGKASGAVRVREEGIEVGGGEGAQVLAVQEA